MSGAPEWFHRENESLAEENGIKYIRNGGSGFFVDHHGGERQVIYHDGVFEIADTPIDGDAGGGGTP